MTRPKTAGLRRNLAVAMGNRLPAGAIADLTVAGEDRASVDAPEVGEHVEWARAQVMARTDVGAD